jgi:hypothetical protein
MKFIHAKMTFIHVGGLKSHLVLNNKLKAPRWSSLFMHKPSSWICVPNIITTYQIANINPHTIEVVQPIINNDRGSILQ